MTTFSRRGLLGVGFGATLTAHLAADTFAPAPAHADTVPVERFGLASQTAAIVSMVTMDGRAYAVTRGETPAVLGEFDLATRRFVRTVRLDRGDGAWALTVSGSAIYAGTYPFPDLYRFDPATGEVRLIGTIGPSGGYIWCLTTASDGTIYAGTYPRGEVWEHNPATGTLRNLGRAVATDQYVRVITCDDQFVYAGTLLGHVVRYDRATGAKTEITPPGVLAACSSILIHGDRLHVAGGLTIADMATDGSDVRTTPVPDVERLVDAMTVSSDGTLYCVGRPSGTVYRRDESGLTPVAIPAPGDEHRGISFLDDHTLLGAAGSGRFWWLDTLTGEFDVVELLDAGLAVSEPVQSLVYEPGRRTVHVGGHFAITSHRPFAGTRRRIRVPGEPKQMRLVDGRIYAAMYPSTEILEVDPRTGQFRSYGIIRNGQQRPTDMEYLWRTDQLLVTTGPPSGSLQGALTVIDRRRQTLDVYVDVVPSQGVVSVALEGGIAYLAGDTWGGGNIPPVRPSASVVAFDVRRREPLWEIVPFAGYASLQHITVRDGVLYGVYKRPAGTWFTFDLATQTVIQKGLLASYGELMQHRGRVFGAVHGGTIYHLGPGLEQPVVIADGLGMGWYNPPQLVFEPWSWHAWTTADRDLARLSIRTDSAGDPVPVPDPDPARPDPATIPFL